MAWLSRDSRREKFNRNDRSELTVQSFCKL
jgi:hypothetical protein